MRRRSGIMSIGIALIMLIFSLVAATVISNISSNLYKKIVVMDEDKELQYRRIVVMSLKNAADYIDDNFNIEDITEPSTMNFSFAVSEALVRSPQSDTFPAYTWTFPATASLAASNVTVTSPAATFSFVELYTKHSSDTEDYGIVVQYDQNN